MKETFTVNRKLLLELNLESVFKKPHAELVSLCLSLAECCCSLFERINKNSSNSSISPSTFIPGCAANDDAITNQKKITEKNTSEISVKKVRQKRSQGYGRTIKLPISEVIDLYPLACDSCQHIFSDKDYQHAKCYTAYEQVDLVDSETGFGGLIGINRQSKLYQVYCSECQTITRYRIPRQTTSEDKIILTPWRVIGSRLSAVICYLKYEARMSLRKIQHALFVLFGVSLSLGVLCRNIHETGLSAEPIAGALTAEIQQSEIIHADETGWKEGKKHLWLWVFTSIHTCLFLIGGRTKKMAQSLFENVAYQNWLMSDGYLAYREYPKRFRCWAHLERKAKGISETATIDGVFFGIAVLKAITLFKDAIYKARQENSVQSIKANFTKELSAFKAECQRYVNSSHPSTSALAKEFLYDWDSIFRILDYPHFPLTNNLAERALRHWVIIRKITQGTRTSIGSKTTAILASIIATCKLRAVNIIYFVQDTVAAARHGMQVPMFEAVKVW